MTIDDKISSIDQLNIYLGELTHSWLKILTLLAAVLIPGFLILDYFSVPNAQFMNFVTFRFASTAIMLAIHIMLRFTSPGKVSIVSGYLVSFVIAGTIVMMTVILGGFDSSYYAGLNLVIIAINLLLPWRPFHSIANSLVTILLYIGGNLLFGGEYLISNLLNNIFFLVSTAVITIVINFLRYNLTLKEYNQRINLQNAQVDEIREIAEIAQHVATGNLTIRINKQLTGTAGILETAFDKMITELHNALLRIREVTNSVAQFNLSIKSNTDTLTHGAKSQLDTLAQSLDIIKSMTDSIIKCSTEVLHTDELADKAIRTAATSGKHVDEAVGGMNRIEDVIKTTSNQVMTLSKSSEKINEIAQVIRDIADQTNLLALNAAIEAARAGEQGKGFTVVAEEVGKLADRTSGATKEITETINQIIGDIKSAVSSMDLARREVDTSIGNVNKMHEAMREIIELSNTLRDMISCMAMGDKEQTQVAGHINENLTNIKDITLGLSNSIENIAGTISEMSEFTLNLEALVNKFKLE